MCIELDVDSAMGISFPVTLSSFVFSAPLKMSTYMFPTGVERVWLLLVVVIVFVLSVLSLSVRCIVNPSSIESIFADYYFCNYSIILVIINSGQHLFLLWMTLSLILASMPSLLTPWSPLFFFSLPYSFFLTFYSYFSFYLELVHMSKV